MATEEKTDTSVTTGTDDAEYIKNLKTKAIGLIPGTGNMGKSLAVKYCAKGFTVYLGSRTPDSEKSKKAKEEIEKRLKDTGCDKFKFDILTNEDAASKSDIIFWGISGELKARHESLRKIAPSLDNKTVIDITNILYMYYPNQGEDVWGQVSAVLQNKEVIDNIKDDNGNIKYNVKWTTAFKSAFAKLWNDNDNDQIAYNKDFPRHTFVCSDNDDAKKETIALINILDTFKGIDCGPLRYSKIIELLGPLYCFRMDQWNAESSHHGGWMYTDAKTLKSLYEPKK